jgi:hypothetical protein
MNKRQTYTATFRRPDGRTVSLHFYGDNAALAFDHAAHVAFAEGFALVSVRRTPGIDVDSLGLFV